MSLLWLITVENGSPWLVQQLVCSGHEIFSTAFWSFPADHMMSLLIIHYFASPMCLSVVSWLWCHMIIWIFGPWWCDVFDRWFVTALIINLFHSWFVITLIICCVWQLVRDKAGHICRVHSCFMIMLVIWCWWQLVRDDVDHMICLTAGSWYTLIIWYDWQLIRDKHWSYDMFDRWFVINTDHMICLTARSW